jgi:radical SAM superfamily enzyme YgiQ (UPF0313 family)
MTWASDAHVILANGLPATVTFLANQSRSDRIESPMPRRIYIVNPLHDYPSYNTSEVLAARGYAAGSPTAELNLPTLAAMASKHLEVEICDEILTPIDFDTEAEIVGITGKISQLHRMRWVADEFRKRGKTVIIGGPHASLVPQSLRDHCDVLVKGEIEEIADEVFSDLQAGTFKNEYTGSKPDITLSPLPDWTTYPNDRVITGIIQISRGCPFECEFCDVIPYLGRKQRHKTDQQIVGELDNLYRLGYRSVYIADDNFTATRKRAKEILIAIRDWNLARTDGIVQFNTPVSLDAAKDEEILQLSADAGLTRVFIGIETPNVDSLKETKKRQNLKVDIQAQVQRFLDFGLAVTGGMIVGFDNDGPGIFQQQYEFAMESGIPIFTLGALVAPAQTPLYYRLEREGRLVPEDTKNVMQSLHSNIVPTRMTREEMTAGITWLCNKLYHPTAFGERIVNMISRMGARTPLQSGAGYKPNHARRSVEHDVADIIANIKNLGPDEEVMMERINKALEGAPDLRGTVNSFLFRYMQIRYMYEQENYWEPQLASSNEPDLSATATPLTRLRTKKVSLNVAPG